MTAASAAGSSIRLLREAAGLTLTQVESLTGRPADYLARVEKGTAGPVADTFVANTVSELSRYIAGAR